MSCLQDKVYRLASVLLVFVLASPMAQATILTNDQSGVPSAMVPGGSLQDMITGNVSMPNFVTQFSESAETDPSSTFCIGCLALVYELTSNGPGINERFTTTFSSAGIQVEAGYDPASGMPAPTDVARGSNGSVIGFEYPVSNNVLPGETTP